MPSAAFETTAGYRLSLAQIAPLGVAVVEAELGCFSDLQIASCPHATPAPSTWSTAPYHVNDAHERNFPQRAPVIGWLAALPTRWLCAPTGVREGQAACGCSRKQRNVH